MIKRFIIENGPTVVIVCLGFWNWIVIFLKLTWHLKIGGWKTTFLLGWPSFRGSVTLFYKEPASNQVCCQVCHDWRSDSDSHTKHSKMSKRRSATVLQPVFQVKYDCNGCCHWQWSGEHYVGNFGVVLCIWYRNQTVSIEKLVTSIIHVITSHPLNQRLCRWAPKYRWKPTRRLGPFNLRPSAMVWSLDTSCTCSAGVAISWARIAGWTKRPKTPCRCGGFLKRIISG